MGPLRSDALIGWTSLLVARCGGIGKDPGPTLPSPALPMVASFSPTHGAFGFQVVISGTNFSSPATVRINGVAASLVGMTGTTITAAVPSAATTGPISVTTAQGSSTSASIFTVDRYGPPIQVKSGGTYSGNWQSLDPAVPAVFVATNEPVVIENCRISSAGDGVRAYGVNANVTIRGCTGTGLNPNVAGMLEGWFLAPTNFSSLAAEHNLITGFRGTTGFNYPLNLAESTKGQVVRFRYDVVHDIDGRYSDGHGGFVAGNFGPAATATWASAIAVSDVRDADIEYAWNEVVTQSVVCQPEDVFAESGSRGIAGNPINIHDKYVQGVNPANAATYQRFGGCGVQAGDAADKDDVGYIHGHDNQIVNFSFCGLSISSGHHIEVDPQPGDRRGTLSDGTAMNNNWRVPLQINDYYWDPDLTGQPVGAHSGTTIRCMTTPMAPLVRTAWRRPTCSCNSAPPWSRSTMSMRLDTWRQRPMSRRNTQVGSRGSWPTVSKSDHRSEVPPPVRSTTGRGCWVVRRT